MTRSCFNLLKFLLTLQFFIVGRKLDLDLPMRLRSNKSLLECVSFYILFCEERASDKCSVRSDCKEIYTVKDTLTTISNLLSTN